MMKEVLCSRGDEYLEQLKCMKKDQKLDGNNAETFQKETSVEKKNKAGHTATPVADRGSEAKHAHILKRSYRRTNPRTDRYSKV